MPEVLCALQESAIKENGIITEIELSYKPISGYVERKTEAYERICKNKSIPLNYRII